jgi:hypothetical protein
MSTAAAVLVTAPSARSTSVTTGSKAADTGCSARIKATRTAPGEQAVLDELQPASLGERRWPSPSR